MNKLINGDCVEELKNLDSNSVDSLVTDPPAGISFMNKSWDSDKGGRDHWIKWMESVMTECLRVMKPGAHGLVWALPRTSHWTAAALENAGFEVRDVVTHLFGSGFPKSLDISKAIDKAAGAEREIIGSRKKNTATHFYDNGTKMGSANYGVRQGDEKIKYETIDLPITGPSTDAAKQWQGWWTALKPASEHWVLIRKPLGEKTVAANVLKHGTGGINIDSSRIETNESWSIPNNATKRTSIMAFDDKTSPNSDSLIKNRAGAKSHPQGRFPSNLVLTEGVATETLNAQSGQDASRFFYVAKISSSERGEGNTHPTIKSKKLMSYLIRMITPPGGTVLDPFMGSGSTGVAAKECGFDFIGIEKETEYHEISVKRVESGLT